MNERESWDAIVVGAGAAGGIAALELTRAGLRVLLLEAGPAEGRVEAGWQPTANQQAVQGVCGEFSGLQREYFADEIAEPYEGAGSFRWIRGRGLGGRIRTWWGACPRWTSEELGEALSPDDPVRWPLSLDDLEPHFHEIERLLDVRNVHRSGAQHSWELGDLSSATAGEQDIHRRLGVRVPDARILPVPYAWGCDPAKARQGPGPSSTAFALREARATGLLEVRTGAVVRQLLYTRDGRRGEGVDYLWGPSMEPRQALARSIVLAASSFESVRILLTGHHRPEYPMALRSSTSLGCFLMDHVLGGPIRFTLPHLPATVPEEELRSPGLYLPFPTAMDLGGGFQVQIQLAKTYAVGKDTYRLGTLRFFGAMVARDSNRMELHPRNVDRWGRNIPKIIFEYANSERRLYKRARAEVEAIVHGLDGTIVEDVDGPALPGESIHELGGARMGRHQSTSTLDPWCRLWAAPNVLVVDGACFVSSGFNNPTLTILAIAQRACRQLCRDLGARP